MKKTILILLLVTMLVSIMLYPVAAAGIQATLSANVETAKPGDTIDFTVSMGGDAACQSFGLIIKYDDDVFEVVKGKCSISGSWISTFDKDRGFVALYANDTIPSGQIGTMQMRVKENAPSGDYTVTFKTAAKTEKSEDVPFTSNSVTIKIEGDSSATEKPTETPVEKPTEAPTQTPVEPTVPSVQQPTEHKHTYSDTWTWNREQHWKVCTSCGEKNDVQDHTPGPEATETEHQRCTLCQGVIKPALEHSHKYNENWVFDSNAHWHECECGEKDEFSNHTWNNENVCSVCSAIKIEDIPVVQPTTPAQPGEEKVPETSASTEPVAADDQGLTDTQWGIGALILVVVVALGVTAYIIIAKKRQG